MIANNLLTIVLHILFFFRPTFPEYLLDFGCVVSGLTVSRRIVLTNIAPSALSLTTPQSSLTNTGFSVTLDPKIKDLPPGEIIDFTVQFDPASVNSSLGYTEAMLPIQVRELAHMYCVSTALCMYLSTFTCMYMYFLFCDYLLLLFFSSLLVVLFIH